MEGFPPAAEDSWGVSTLARGRGELSRRAYPDDPRRTGVARTA
jgi:hypothetical protein